MGDIEKEVLFIGIYRNQLTEVCVAWRKSSDARFN